MKRFKLIQIIIVPLLLTACADSIDLTPDVTADLVVETSTTEPTEVLTLTTEPIENAPTATMVPFELIPIASGSTMGVLSWSPDENFIARWPNWGSDQLSFINIHTGEECPSPLTIGWDFGHPGTVDWLPDNRVFLVSGSENRAVIFTPCTGEVEELTSALPAGIISASAAQSVSPDGSKILLTASDGPFIYDLASGQAVWIDPQVTFSSSPNDGSDFLNGVAWSPDSARFSVVSYQGQYQMAAWVVDAETGTARNLSDWEPEHDAPHGEFVDALWLNDSLLFVNNAVASGPYFYDIEQGTSTNIAVELFGQPLGTCDGAFCQINYRGKIVVADGRSHYKLILQALTEKGTRHWLYRSDTGEVESLPDARAYYFSPDGNWLMAHADAGDFIETIAVRRVDEPNSEFTLIYTGELKDFGEGYERDGALFWFDNETRLGISKNSFTAYSIPPDGRDPLVLYTISDDSVWGCASPGGRYVLISGGQGPIYLIDAAGLPH